LIHEATFRHDKQEHAQQFGHTTVAEAAELAKKAAINTLILTHISSRYAGEDEEMLQEALSIFSNSILAHDLMVYSI
jgi:ribonuclease Z